MSGYAFHPDAFADLDEIWEYIAQDNIDAADRVLADIHAVLRTRHRTANRTPTS
jgi:plasmid stabilization system protein ParE